MPRGDAMPAGRQGTGPLGQGPMTGRGLGRGVGMGRSQGSGRGRTGLGPGGNCVCPACGTKSTHQAGMPCATIKCSKCGIRMVRG
jgi:uncharacterized protein